MGEIIEFHSNSENAFNIQQNSLADIVDFNGHQLLRFEAAREGLSYQEYRRKLYINDIPLDIAIENVKKGVSVKEYLAKQERIRKTYRTAVYTEMIAAILTLFLASAIGLEPSRYHQALIEYKQTSPQDKPKLLEKLNEEEVYIFGFPGP